MGTASYGGKGFKGRVAASSDTTRCHANTPPPHYFTFGYYTYCGKKNHQVDRPAVDNTLSIEHTKGMLSTYRCTEAQRKFPRRHYTCNYVLKKSTTKKAKHNPTMWYDALVPGHQHKMSHSSQNLFCAPSAPFSSWLLPFIMMNISCLRSSKAPILLLSPYPWIRQQHVTRRLSTWLYHGCAQLC